MMNEKEIYEFFHSIRDDYNAEESRYISYHIKRYTYLLQMVDDLIKRIISEYPERKINILVIGPSFELEMLRKMYPQYRIISLGFTHRIMNNDVNLHCEYDLNNIASTPINEGFDNNDIIILSEVIEHLYVSPLLLLKTVSDWINSNGYLIIQTPNALALNKRLGFLFGNYPLQIEGGKNADAGHYHEFTSEELTLLAEKAGYTVQNCEILNYFTRNNKLNNIYNVICNILPNNLRDGIQICLRYPSEK